MVSHFPKYLKTRPALFVLREEGGKAIPGPKVQDLEGGKTQTQHRGAMPIIAPKAALPPAWEWS